MRYTIENDVLRVVIDSLGAEIVSVTDLRHNRECVWTGNAEWWKRHTPILFPIVGALWHGTMRHEGKEYRMSQHGFARDMEFEAVEVNDNSAEFILRSNPDTKEKYPFDFELRIKHSLDKESLTTKWTVSNIGAEEMHFQIGGHPAYMLPNIDDNEEVAGYIDLIGTDRYNLTQIESEGCVAPGNIPFQGDRLIITHDTFRNDAIIFEQVCPKEVVMCDRNNTPVLTFTSGCPALGIWAPHKEIHAPFVCIEPWWGRTDRTGYSGEFKDKEYMNPLLPATSQSGEWTVTFH